MEFPRFVGGENYFPFFELEGQTEGAFTRNCAKTHPWSASPEGLASGWGGGRGGEEGRVMSSSRAGYRRKRVSRISLVLGDQRRDPTVKIERRLTIMAC